MEQYLVTGMSCAACSARVEKAVRAVEGVETCSVNLLTNSMQVEGTAASAVVIAAVEKAGYGASLKNGEQTSSQAETEDQFRDRETPVLKRRLLTSLGFLLLLMYLSMGHTMWHFPLPAILAENPIAQGILQMLLTIIVMVINQKFFINGFKSLWHLAPNMDTLVALGSSASFVYSAYMLFAMTNAQLVAGTEAAAHYLHEFYFESAAMILTLITVGKMLEARSKGKTTNALRSLMQLAPKTAVVLRNGEEVTIPAADVRKGDVFLVRPAASIPADGVVLEGASAVNEASLTGESMPVDKGVGDHVSAATLNQSGFLKCEATHVGEDTALSKIIQMVSDAAASKAPIAKAADKVSGIFVPVVIGIALLTLVVWLLVGETIGFALARSISVLVISCPCALGLATPVAIMVGSGMGAKHGILFKTATSLETTGKVQIIALDKTGTITLGSPKVTNLLPEEGISEQQLLQYAYHLEQQSEHPLAAAIVQAAKERGMEAANVTAFQAVAGNGLQAVLGEEQLQGGNLRFVSQFAKIPQNAVETSEKLASEGKTPLFFCKNGTLLGIVAVADVLKEDSPQAVQELRNMGMHVVMLTGDHERTARAIGERAGVDEVIAGVLPDGKEAVIRRLQQQGRVAMVGDGINDAPALTRADVGIAIGAGTDVAIDAADVVLMKNSLRDVPAAIRLSRATLRNIHQNLFWAFIYNAIGIPLAAGCWIPLLHWELNPMFGAAAMSLSSFCVVTNALRLNFFGMYRADQDKTIHFHYVEKEEETAMTKTMKIEGMMCGHCEAAVKKALEALETVASAEVSHTAGTAVVTLTAPTEDAVLKKAVEDKDYTVLDIA